MAEYIDEFIIDDRFHCGIEVERGDFDAMSGVVTIYYDGNRPWRVRNTSTAHSVSVDYRSYRFDESVVAWASENHFGEMPVLLYPVNANPAIEVGITLGWTLFFATIDDAVAFRMRWM